MKKPILHGPNKRVLHDNGLFRGLVLSVRQSNRFQPLLLGVDMTFLELFDCPLKKRWIIWFSQVCSTISKFFLNILVYTMVLWATNIGPAGACNTLLRKSQRFQQAMDSL